MPQGHRGSFPTGTQMAEDLPGPVVDHFAARPDVEDSHAAMAGMARLLGMGGLIAKRGRRTAGRQEVSIDGEMTAVVVMVNGRGLLVRDGLSDGLGPEPTATHDEIL